MRVSRVADINECETEANLCAANTVCVNTIGGFNCVSPKATRRPPSTAAAANPLLTPRQRITCQPGFKILMDRCADIDECAGEQPLCDTNQQCVNQPGSFRCECKVGFKLDAITNACVGEWARTAVRTRRALCDDAHNGYDL